MVVWNVVGPLCLTCSFINKCSLWFPRSRKHEQNRDVEFDNKNGINCKMWNIVEFAKTWMQFIKINSFPSLQVFFWMNRKTKPLFSVSSVKLEMYSQIWTSRMNRTDNSGLCVQPAERRVHRDRLKSATPNRDATKIFSNFTVVQCRVPRITQQCSPVGGKMFLNRKTRNSEKLKWKTGNLGKVQTDFTVDVHPFM